MERPVDRPRPRWAMVLAALALVACDVGRSNPLASFESRCAQLPASRFEVSAIPVTYAQDDSQSSDQLTERSGRTPGRHLTFGLTTVHFGHRTQIEIHTVDDPAGARACATLNVDVILSMQPMSIFLAQELDGSSCARNATLEHELKHVAVFREVLEDAARDLAAVLAGAIGQGLQRAGSQAELQRRLNAQVNDHLSEFMLRRHRDMDARQNGVDSAQEYARVKAACGT